MQAAVLRTDCSYKAGEEVCASQLCLCVHRPAALCFCLDLAPGPAPDLPLCTLPPTHPFAGLPSPKCGPSLAPPPPPPWPTSRTPSRGSILPMHPPPPSNCCCSPSHRCSPFLDCRPRHELLICSSSADASYGQRSSSELLLSYGFLPDSGTNPYDSVDIEVSFATSQAAVSCMARTAVKGNKHNFHISRQLTQQLSTAFLSDPGPLLFCMCVCVCVCVLPSLPFSLSVCLSHNPPPPPPPPRPSSLAP